MCDCMICAPVPADSVWACKSKYGGLCRRLDARTLAVLRRERVLFRREFAMYLSAKTVFVRRIRLWNNSALSLDVESPCETSPGGNVLVGRHFKDTRTRVTHKR